MPLFYRLPVLMAVLVILSMSHLVMAEETPVAHWALDEGQGAVANDSSGNAHHGALVNGPVWTLGNVGGGLAFNGFDQAVVVPDGPLLAAPSQLTIAAWVRHGSTASFRAIVDKRDDVADGYDLYLTDLGTPFLRINDHSVEGFSSIADSTWHHLAGVFDGSRLILYVDGVADAILAYSGAPLDTVADLLLGHHYDTLDVNFGGRLDDVRIYDVALDEEEVLALLAKAGPPGNGGSDGDWVVVGDDMHSAVPGNVGIGTSTPTRKLEVVGDIQASGAICDGNGDCVGDVAPSPWQSSGLDVYTLAGQVGIGTSAPTERLEVDGTVLADRFVGDGSGLTNLPGTHAGELCPEYAYVRGFDAAGGLVCDCLPGRVETSGACLIPPPGTYQYYVNPYGGCAGAGMDVRLERRYGVSGWEYRVTYKFRSDYAWQSDFSTSDWFTSTVTFDWAYGRDHPWFSVALGSGSTILFRRGACKGGTSPSWGYAEWSLSDGDFLS